MTQSAPIPVLPVQNQKSLPAWASVLLILLCIAAGGALIWWYLSGSDTTKRIVLDDNSPQAKEFQARTANNRRQNFGGGPPQEMPLGIRQDGEAYNVRSGDFRMRVTKRNGAANFRMDSVRGGLISQEQNELLVARWRIAQDAAVAKAIDATQEQVDKLKALPGNTSIVLTKEDRDQIGNLWAAWEKSTSKADDEKKLLAAMEEIGKRSVEPTKKSLTDRAEAVKAVLSQEQWDKFKKMGQ